MLNRILKYFNPDPDFFLQQEAIKEKAKPSRFNRKSKASKKGWKKRKGANDNAT